MKCGCVIRATLNDKTGALVLTLYKLTVQHIEVNLSVFLASGSSMLSGLTYLVTVYETMT